MEPLSEEVLAKIRAIALNKREAANRVVLIYGREGIGKTVLAARLGQHNLVVTDEGGWKSLANEGVQHLIGHWDVQPFVGYDGLRILIRGVANGQIPCDECGEPIDNVIIDTLSGMVAHTLKDISTNAGTPKDGRVAPEAAGRPDYMVSRDRLYPLMSDIGMMRNASVTIVAHEKEQEKTITDRIRPDVHNAAFEVIRKYVSVMARMEVSHNGRSLQVKPVSTNSVAAKDHCEFPASVVSDDEFINHMLSRRSIASLRDEYNA